MTGGAEKALINMLRFLDYDKYDVTLWVKDDHGELTPQVDPHVTIRCWGEYYKQDYKQFLFHLLKKCRFVLAAYSFLCRSLCKYVIRSTYLSYKLSFMSLLLADQTEYDAAICYQLLREEDVLFLSYGIKAKEKIGWIHGKFSHNRANPLQKTFFREYPKLDHIFCVSKDCQALFLQQHPELLGKTSVMYNLQDFDTIRTLANEKVEEDFSGLTLVTVGRLSTEKGQDMIPAIAEKLVAQGYQFVWYLVGDGPTRLKLEQEITERNLSNTVVLLGTKNNPYPYIRNCSLYVQPSYREGFCVSTFEAKILGAPVVVTDVSGMSEQFSREEAVFCEPDVDSLTEGIDRAIQEQRANKTVSYAIPFDFNLRELKKLYEVIEG